MTSKHRVAFYIALGGCGANWGRVVLAKDPDPAATKALADAVGDKSWLVRAAALEALAKRGDPSVLDTVKLYMSDEKDAVKYTAAAAVLRLMAIKESGLPVMEKKKKENEKKRKE